ncbi:MAG: 2'-5' RNA ligase family protein [Polyangiales bacterium]
MSPNWFIAFPMQVEGLRLRPDPPPRVRVFALSDLHVTLGFLGQVQESDARKAWERIGDFPSFRRVVGSFSAVEPLGHPRKPSALSAMVDVGREPLSEMIAEARDSVLRAAGAPPDPRPPLPHMTLARIQRRATGAERREAVRWAQALDLDGVSFAAPSVALYTWAEDRQTRLFRIVETQAFES